MAPNDLFSFLNNDNDSEISDSETALNAMQVDNVSNTGLVHASTPSNKRPATSPVPETRISSPPSSPPIEDGPPVKRKRLDIASTSAPAVVVDEFETEAKREVAASAGLTGATEMAGSRLELRYQARLHRSFLELLADCRF
jgi:ATP-dependent RNA helicase DOB1